MTHMFSHRRGSTSSLHAGAHYYPILLTTYFIWVIWVIWVRHWGACGYGTQMRTQMNRYRLHLGTKPVCIRVAPMAALRYI
jgi:hypothetical protein